jgi:manganese-dependent inorganic pyrophosphatase
LQHILFCAIDILAEENICFISDEVDSDFVSKAFGVSVVDGQASLGNILSRKKQLVPLLEKYFAG